MIISFKLLKAQRHLLTRWAFSIEALLMDSFVTEHKNREPQAKSVLINSDSQCILIGNAIKADCRDSTGAVPYDDYC